MQLPAIVGLNQAISLIQLDASYSLARELDEFDEIAHAGSARFIELQSAFLELLSPHVSGVVLDPVSYYGLPDKAASCGVIFALDFPTSEQNPESLPVLMPHWGVEHVRQNYGLAKLSMYYHPQEPNAAVKQALVAELFEATKQQSIGFILELQVVPLAADENTKEQVSGDDVLFEDQLFAIQEFRNSCDVIGLEFPRTALNAATITAELAVPWVVAHRVESYETFKNQVRVGVESGARGYLAGEVFWSDRPWRQNQQLNLDAARADLKTTVRDRVIELTRIAQEGIRSQNQA
jgi:tagatose-1,6-bisphosphate aldolase